MKRSVHLIVWVSLCLVGSQVSTVISKDAEIGQLKEGAGQIIGSRFLDVDGNIRRLGDENGAGPAVLVFVDDHCPVSARYLGELNDFAAYGVAKGIDFYAVLSNPFRTWTEARQLRDDYGLMFPVLLDPSGDLATRLSPVRLGEVFVVNGNDRMIYRGRIDDRFADIGRLRQVIGQHDLYAVMDAAADPGFQPYATAPVGCFFESWNAARKRPVTFTRDIAPVLDANCVECHQQGGVAPFPLKTYRDAAQRSQMLKFVTAENLMPPWRPRPEHGRFRDERYLTQNQKDLFSRWIEDDVGVGDTADASPPVKLPDPGWRFGKPDLILQLQEPFNVPAKGPDIYRYFVIPSGLIRDQTVTAIDFKPGDPTVVHHANFFADYSGRARNKDAEDAEPGFSVFGTGEFMSYDGSDEHSFGIGGWAPGAEPYSLPKDVGLWLPAGGDIVIEIHYKLNGRTTVDQSSIGLYFAEKPTLEYIDGLLLGTQDLDIPPETYDYTRHISMDVPVGFRLVDVMPHMHYIGSRTRMTVTRPDGSIVPVFGIDDWDLRWQNIYTLREPMHIPAGSRVDIWWVWNNSSINPANPFDPPRRMKWGWKSEEEMAEVWMGVLPDNPDRRDELLEAAYRAWGDTDSKPLPQ
jgi:hypothetical protein